MKRLALVSLAVILLLPAAPAPARNVLPAKASALYLTFREAKREIRGRARRDARADGARLEYIEISQCLRYSARRIRCYLYREQSDGLTCEGEMQVIEFRPFFRTQGIGTECY